MVGRLKWWLQRQRNVVLLFMFLILFVFQYFAFFNLSVDVTRTRFSRLTNHGTVGSLNLSSTQTRIATHTTNMLLFSTDQNPVQNITRENVRIGSKCNLFSVSWVYDLSYTLYNGMNCPYLDGKVTCQKNGRLDLDYQKWRWKP